MLKDNKSTPREHLDLLSNIRKICKDTQKEAISTIKYINDILLDINIDLTYNTIMSSQNFGKISSEEEEKIPSSSQVPYSHWWSPITLPFITNMSILRLNNLSSKLSSAMYLSNAKDKVITLIIF